MANLFKAATLFKVFLANRALLFQGGQAGGGSRSFNQSFAPFTSPSLTQAVSRRDSRSVRQSVLRSLKQSRPRWQSYFTREVWPALRSSRSSNPSLPLAVLIKQSFTSSGSLAQQSFARSSSSSLPQAALRSFRRTRLPFALKSSPLLPQAVFAAVTQAFAFTSGPSAPRSSSPSLLQEVLPAASLLQAVLRSLKHSFASLKQSFAPSGRLGCGGRLPAGTPLLPSSTSLPQAVLRFLRQSSALSGSPGCGWIFAVLRWLRWKSMSVVILGLSFKMLKQSFAPSSSSKLE